MKATNLVIGDPRSRGCRVSLVDCDAVRFNVTMSPAQRARNLWQFCDNLPATVGPADRLRVAAAYGNEAGLNGSQVRDLVRRVEHLAGSERQ